jgi:hypothetical protein
MDKVEEFFLGFLGIFFDLRKNSVFFYDDEKKIEWKLEGVRVLGC